MAEETTSGWNEAKKRAGLANKPNNTMNLEDITTAATKIPELDSAKMRHEAAIGAMATHDTSIHAQAAYIKEEEEQLDDKVMGDMYQTILDDALNSKDGKGIEYATTMEWMKKFSNILMPIKKMGVKDAIEQNFNHVKAYLTIFDSLRQQNPGTTLEEVRKMISKGQGRDAWHILRTAINETLKYFKHEEILDYHLPKGDYKREGEAVEQLVSDINERRKKAGMDLVEDAEVRKNPRAHYRNLIKTYVQEAEMGTKTPEK